MVTRVALNVKDKGQAPHPIRTDTRAEKLKEQFEVLEGGLPIDEHALDEALQQQPELFYQVSKMLALQVSRRDAAKQQVAEVEAAIDTELRNDAKKAEEKISEKQLEALKIQDPEVKVAYREYLELCQTVGLLTALEKAYQQRSYVLKDLVTLYVANYFGDGSNRSSRNNAASEISHADTRRALNDERRRSK